MTSFQKKVYEVVKRIPKGKVMTYKILAKLAGHPKAYRAAGSALNKNRNPKIPCHRIIKSDGKMGGYNRGTKKKTILLKKEGIIIKDGKITSRATK